MSIHESKSMQKTKTLVGMAIFTALVVVLQLLSTVIRIGPFAPSLVLIPIVIGAAVYGVKSGAWLGFVFGVVVLAMCITGADAGGFMMFEQNALATALICLVKGTAAGTLAGLTYRTLAKFDGILATIAAAIVCPVVNTGLFVLGAVAVFQDLLIQWQVGNGYGGSTLTAYIFLGMIGLNFLVELAINLVLSPIVVRILKVRKQCK